jgi:hypothetical protein
MLNRSDCYVEGKVVAVDNSQGYKAYKILVSKDVCDNKEFTESGYGSRVTKTVFVPFQVSAAVQAPKGEKLKRGVASFVGLPIYGQTNKANTSPEVLMERKKTRKETMRANKEKKLERM